MSMNRESMLRSYAASLAEGLLGEEGRRRVELMQRLGLLTEADAPPEPAQAPGAIGIWEPRMEGDRIWFERSEARSGEWSLWADVPRLEPRGERPRVVLLGESVARGYFYDPSYTPARVLEELLAAHGVPGVEVIDLAKNDLGAQDLQALLLSALALQPDAFVIFSGNNWAQAPAVFAEGPERHLAAAALGAMGAPGLRAYLEANLAAQVESAVRDGLAPLSHQLGGRAGDPGVQPGRLAPRRGGGCSLAGRTAGTSAGSPCWPPLATPSPGGGSRRPRRSRTRW